ncbi:MAG: hypothetical protein IJZ37_02425 [Clostridia bacterium]|nr:hypothetical protein [Clostridia bacterium]
MKKVSPKPPSKTLNAPNCRLAKKGVIFFAIARLKFWSSFYKSLRFQGRALGAHRSERNARRLQNAGFSLFLKSEHLVRAFLFESGACTAHFFFAPIAAKEKVK